MSPDEYVKNAVKTESKDLKAIAGRFEGGVVRLSHAMIGMCTEAGEFQDAVKKHLFYGKPLDTVNLAEELGDLMWYVAIACDTLGVSLQEVMEKNIAKLKARYGDKFTEEAALNRNLEKERTILEK